MRWWPLALAALALVAAVWLARFQVVGLGGPNGAVVLDRWFGTVRACNVQTSYGPPSISCGEATGLD